MEDLKHLQSNLFHYGHKSNAECVFPKVIILLKCKFEHAHMMRSCLPFNFVPSCTCLLPVQAWVQVGPMRIPLRHSPSRHQRWSVSGSLIPASSSSSPAGPALSARRAPLAHTCSARRSSCGDKRKSTGFIPGVVFLKKWFTTQARADQMSRQFRESLRQVPLVLQVLRCKKQSLNLNWFQSMCAGRKQAAENNHKQ